MLIRVLGSAAGGGVPQWNCGCGNCRGARSGGIPVRRRTQTSVAVSVDGERWILLGVSPEVRAQIERFAALHPRALRHTPIEGIVLANGDLDHCLGLLSLRESQPLRVWSTEAVRRGITTDNVLWRTLEREAGQITWRHLSLDGRGTEMRDGVGRPLGLSVGAIPVPGKVPLHLEGRAVPRPDDVVAVIVRETERPRSLVFAPAVAAPSLALEALLREADCILFDGTFWSTDELPALGIGRRRAEEMGHWPVGGRGGSLGLLARLTRARRILVHLNNTNPLVRDDSAARRAAEAAGVEVAHDGLDVTL